MRERDVVPWALLGATLVIGSGALLPGTFAVAVGVLATAWLLREEGIYGRYASVTALVYVLTWALVTITGWGVTGFLQSELEALLLFGLLGCLHTGLQVLARRSATSVRRFTAIGVLGNVLSALFGAATVLAVAWRIKRLFRPQTFVAVGAVPGMVLNYLFRTTDLWLVSDLLVAVTSVATIGFVLGAAFLADSMTHAVSGFRRVSGRTQPEDSGAVLQPEEFESLTDTEFREVVDLLVRSAHERVEWWHDAPNGTTFAYARTGTADELVVGRRARTLPPRRERFELELLREIEGATDRLGGVPARVCFVTDAVLADECFLALRYRGFDVVDAAALHEIGIELTPAADPRPQPGQ